MSSRPLKNRRPLLTVIFLLVGVLAVSALFLKAKAETIALNIPLVVTAGKQSESVQPFLSEETAEEDAMVQDLAIKYYAKKYKVSHKEALKRLEIQDKASGIEDKLADLLGGKFAGIWYDARRGGRVQIGLVPSAKDQLPKVKLMVREHGISGVADLVNTRYSIAELQNIQQRVSKDITEMITAGRARIGFNPMANGVRVTVVTGLTRAEKQRLRKITAVSGVYIRESKAKSLRVHFDDCGVRVCDPPMRGAREIKAPAGTCTGAFTAKFRNNPNVKAVMTAGHCIFAAGGFNIVWSSNDQAGTLHEIGQATGFSFAGSSGEDDGIIQIDNSGFWGSPAAVGKVVVKASDDTTYNPNYHIHSDSMSSIGQILCMTGRTTGTHCGEVGDLGEEISADLLGQSFTLTNMGELEACDAKAGDSGGPLYKNKKAYGIHSSTGGSIFDCDEFYQGIRTAQNSMKVDLIFNE